MRRGGMRANVFGLPQAENLKFFRPVSMPNKETTFSCNRKASLRTESVAKCAGGLGQVKPINKCLDKIRS